MVNKGNIPTYQQQAGYTATVNPNVPQGSPSGYGTTVAKEMAGFNENLAKLGDQIAQHAIKMQQQEDDNAVVRQENSLRAYMNEVLYDPNNGLAVKKGHDAKGATSKFDEVVSKTMDDVMSNMVSDNMKAKLYERTATWLGQYRNIISRNEGDEVRTAILQDIKTNYSNAAEVAMKAPGATSFNTLVIQAQTNKADLMHFQGFSSETANQAIQETLSQTYAEMAEVLYSNGDTQGLLDLYEVGHGKVTTDATVKVSRMCGELKSQMAGEKIVSKYINDARYKNANGTINEAKAVEAIENEIGPNARKIVRRYVGGGNAGYSNDTELDSVILEASKTYGVNPEYVAAMAKIESGYNQDAVSEAGAIGIMQLMPDTAEALGVDPNDKKDNINGGAKYLAHLIGKYGDTEEGLRKAVMAYNAGENAVDTGNLVSETLNHWTKFKDALEEIKASNKKPKPVDISDIPMQDIEDKGLAGTNETLKRNFRQLYDWALDRFGKQVEISGGKRSEENNRANHGADNSHHLYGSAIDVNVSMLTDAEREEFINKAREMGFNKDGDDFYHNKGTGYHAHLTYESDGKDQGPGHWEEVEVSAYNEKEYKAAMAALSREVRTAKNNHDNTIQDAINALIPTITAGTTRVEITNIVRSSYPNLTATDIDTISNSVYSSTTGKQRQDISDARSDAAFARQQKRWNREDASEAFYDWKLSHPDASPGDIVEKAKEFGVDSRDVDRIQASYGLGSNLKNGYVWAKNSDNETTFNGVCKDFKLTGIEKSNIREKLNRESERRMDAGEPPLAMEDIRSIVQDEATEITINKSWFPGSGTTIRNADIPYGWTKTDYGVLDPNGNTMEYDENTQEWTVMNS